MSKQESFKSKIGVVLAAAGSAVGLGNIWKFPYMVGENGGSAFLLIYMCCCVLIGLPIMIAEFSIGKRSGTGITNAFRVLRGNNRWQWMGVVGFLVSLMLMSFYSIVTGWCLQYLFHGSSSIGFNIMWALIAILITTLISWLGVSKGLERISKIIMPLLLVILLLLIGRSLMMENSHIGMRFLFKPDFTKLTPSVILNAMGQAFFSLSVGMGVILTYGSYMPKSQNIIATSFQVTILDTIVAILAGLAIFPAVFAMNIDPAEGPQLVFDILPVVFDNMSLGFVWYTLFFSLLGMAAITSLMSMLEVSVSYVTDRWHISRQKSLSILLVIVMLGITACVFSDIIFDTFDTLTSKILMPLGGLCMTIFVGWICPQQDTIDELRKHSKIQSEWFYSILFFLLKYIIPLAIIIIFLNGFNIFY